MNDNIIKQFKRNINTTKKKTNSKKSDSKQTHSKKSDSKQTHSKKTNSKKSHFNSDLKKEYGKMMNKRKVINYQTLNNKNKSSNDKNKSLNKSFVIIVPYRDDKKHLRKKHLDEFIKVIPKLFSKLDNEFKILIVEQNNKDNRFNRGSLLNIGFDICKDNFEYFIFHDVDLIPNNELIPYYGIYPSKPIHLANVWKKYGVGGKYFGGVNSFNRKDFMKVNGYPNNYWGWGGEDDELYDRVSDSNLKVFIPNKGEYSEMKHNKPTNQQKLPFNQKMRLRLQHKDWKKNGLNNLKYEVSHTKKLNKDTSLVSVKF